MIYYVSADAVRSGNGTNKEPFRTIREAAAIAQPGDEVLVLPGIYREYVDPIHGGKSDTERITYRSVIPLQAVITGSERVTNWERYSETVWKTRISNGLFGNYNPYTTVIAGDWYAAEKPVHTGEIYLNGKAMYEAFSIEEVLHPSISSNSWDAEFTVYKWYTVQEGNDTILYANFHEWNPNMETVEINVRRNCFYPSKTGVNYITLSGFTITQAATTWAPPTAYQEGMVGPHWSKGWIIEDCDISHSRCAGISLGKYLQPNNENKWTTKYYKNGTQTERDAICQAQYEGWTKERIGSHVVRRCNIHDCGQTGIVGHLGCVFSIIEDNHIHHINNKQDLAGAEIGGIKLHGAIDVIIRRNHFHHCTRGLWLDWQAQGTRVTQNLFHDNIPPEGTYLTDGLALGEDIFIEVSHGPTLIDNNLLLSPCACRISTQGIALVHNLIAGAFTWVGKGTDNHASNFATPRYTPYHVPHRTEVAGFMTILHGDARFYNNIFVQQPVREDLLCQADRVGAFPKSDNNRFLCGTKPYDGYPTAQEYFSRFTKESVLSGAARDIYYEHLPIYTGGNVYFNGAKPCDHEENYYEDREHEVTFSLVEDGEQWTFETNVYDYIPKMDVPFVSTTLLGEAFEPEQLFEAPDGTAILFDEDYHRTRRSVHTIPGPFASPVNTISLL